MPGPGFIPVSNTAKVVYQGSFRGQQYCGDLWFYHTSGTILPSDLQNLCTQVATAFVPALANEQSSDITYTIVKGRDYTTPTSPTREQGTSVVGGGGDAMPNNVAMAVSFRTGFAGRSNRGRNFVGAIPRAEVAENSVLSSFISPVLAAFELMTVPTFATNWEWSVVSFKTAGAWRPAGVIAPIISVLVVDDIVDDMDKRLPGRGR